MTTVHVVSTADIIWAIITLAFPFMLWGTIRNLRTRKPPATRSVTIVVLGDIGRSPRMMYHAESFANAGFDTVMVGYYETAPPPSLLTAPGIQFFRLMPPPKLPKKLFVFLAPLKVMVQILSLSYALLIGWRPHRPPQFILVQNPPSIPTLAIVQLAAWMRGSNLILDWHNLGYSILALKLGDKHPLVRVASWFERQFGRDAYAHLFVTNAMKEHLCKTWDLQGHKLVLHDRPPSRFHPTSATEAHELFLRLPPFIPSLHDFVKTPDSGSATIRTKLTSPSSESTAVGIFSSSLSPVAALRPDRPAIAISSTSWTADEDFGVLIDALQRYEHAARIRNADKSGPHLPKLLMIVTGKGPLKEAYMRRVLNLEREEKWTWVRCRSIWAEAADYPLLLGASIDSVHRSCD
ncbi:mannosyltransferase [Tulasnella sp. 403]|nr:mannosyltransferase [Tulasnella sp. 403]